MGRCLRRSSAPVRRFRHPDLHGEVIAELEPLRESDTVRVIDALPVYEDAQGEIEVEHLSNLSQEEAIELGSNVGALIGLGIEDEEGLEAGAAAGAEPAAEGVHAFTDEDAWDVIEDIPPDSAAALILLEHRWTGPAARRHRPLRRLPHLGRLDQPAGTRRHRLLSREEAAELHAFETARPSETPA